MTVCIGDNEQGENVNATSSPEIWITIVGRKNGHVPSHIKGDQHGRAIFRARVVQALAEEADPLVKKRLLRLANNDDGMRKQTTRDHVKKSQQF
ncbi:hypothetical protein J6524_17675 [Bradyrhizobium sp. WSM 1738]|uniref:hypothetical protein n=1 Tax=Bradyrhizobium hereditatis TaxID=2821405 RepID=UPI001CE32873|nr:hypothetical protein [Bradyrhizobium hereditatis]MCA6116716.1 hypothetical protein [Bradyrhizobium hereditatis]